MSARTGVLVFEGGQATGGDRGTARGLLATVRRWATLDNVEKFLACPEVDLVAVATDCPDLAAEASRLGATVRQTGPGFHFGRVFRDLVREHGLGRVVYLGGGAVPLLGPAELGFLWQHLAPGERAFVANNAQSPDVIALGCGEAAEVIAGLEADNAAVFALVEAGYERRLLPESAATVFDLDTPTDVVFLAYEVCSHRGRLGRASWPDLGPRLRAGLPTLDLDLGVLERAAAVLGRDDYSTVTLVGRVSGTTVSFLNANFLVRLRVFSEERGMKALGRVERGEVRSLLGLMAADRGVGYLVGALASISDAVFWDDRVLVAHLGGWPDDEDRFLADLGDWRRVKDPLLRDLVRACSEAHVPFVLGGHSVVSGGLRLLGEGLLAERTGLGNIPKPGRPTSAKEDYPSRLQKQSWSQGLRRRRVAKGPRRSYRMAKSLETQGIAEVRGTLKDYEDAIRQIREVMAVRVVPGGRGEIDEIHVLAGNGRAAKQIVRDIESSLLAQFGVWVDHKKISVAQVEESASPGWSTGRPRLVGLRVTTDNSRIEAEVKVAFEDIVHTGAASGPATQTNRLRVPAQAALEAVATYFNSGHEIALDDVLVVETRRNPVVLTVLSLLTCDGEQTLSGSCLVRDSGGEAAARAVLDALNRRFTLLVRAAGQRPGPVPSGNGPES